MGARMKNILITGAAGFIGSNLCDALLKRGCRVTGIDNLSIGGLSNLKEAMSSKNFSFRRMDVLNIKKLNSLAPHSVIVHLAALKMEVPGTFGTDMMEVNSRGTAHMLAKALAWRSRFILASTSEVYGKCPQLPFKETFDLCLGPSDIPRWGYAASKIFDEHLCFAYRRRYGLDVTIMRYFNTYGPRHDLTIKSGGPQALFFDSILRKKPLIVHGDGRQTRCFTFIDDSVEMTVRIIESKRISGEIINIGNPNAEICIHELAKLACRIAGYQKPHPIIFMPHTKALAMERYEEVNRRVPDIAKAVHYLDYRPAIDNEEGLKRTFKWQETLPRYR